ncbi:histidine utilization repressor [Salipiger sp. P9]|uniref:histidine utilization repressor n=1 Tax=Salipiger pentaromativorans TaxID=2943193 RepID=UPI0021588D12|nr:histidine utilization repressor [Salipiger pentaromativorans]MCR8548899.1 histidine utilization repressor [Salipiger pentaromativorans]
MTQTGHPLYEQIKNAIDRRIEATEWPADFQVPTEAELAEEFGASRLTVRRALRELQAEGVLIRIQGRGTFVVGPRMQCAVFNLPDMSEEIAQTGGAHSCRVLQLSVLPRDSTLRHMLQVGAEEPIFHSRLLHLEDGTPIQLEDRFVNAAEAPHYIEQDFTKITPQAYLMRETTVTSVDNTIRAIRADDEARQLLQIDASQPCLLLDRATWRDGIPVTRSRFLYPGDRYRLRSSHEARVNRIVTPTTTTKGR